MLIKYKLINDYIIIKAKNIDYLYIKKRLKIEKKSNNVDFILTYLLIILASQNCYYLENLISNLTIDLVIYLVIDSKILKVVKVFVGFLKKIL